MSKHNKIAKQKEVAVTMLKEERERMERFCILDFHPMAGPKMIAKHEAWVDKIHSMTDAELIVEFNKRDGDHVLEHGCPPEIKDGEEMP